MNYGKYFKSMFYAYGKSAPAMRFTAELPTSGKWSLEYFFPNFEHWDGVGHFYFTLLDNAKELDISIDARSLEGWAELGVFDIVGPTVHLDLVSVEPEGSQRVADAIRWKRLDP